jgi:SAM-dependent methyltransferase
MTTDSTPMDVMATLAVSACYLCGSQGAILHQDLSDPMAGAPGKWNLRRCPNPDCDLVWLDPMPLQEELWKAYRSYFTHRNYVPEGNQRVDWPNLIFLKILKPIYKLFEHATGLRMIEKGWRKKADRMFLGEDSLRGRLLDVGCGKGDLLVRLRNLGWDVEGLDVDSEAVAFSRTRHGLKIHHGSLENQQFPAGSFDAVVMNHVIEHVHDPVALLRECFRVLKHGGRLVLATPNIINSLGYKKLGRYWSHLDIPRHLHLFTKKNIKDCAARAGFRSVDAWCAPGYAEGGAMRVSIEREAAASGKKRWELSKWLEASYLKVLAYVIFFWKKEDEVGEEIFLMAIKDE